MSRVRSFAFLLTTGVVVVAARRTEVKLKEPEARSPRIGGKRRQARAASMRLHAASSESRRAWVQ